MKSESLSTFCYYIQRIDRSGIQRAESAFDTRCQAIETPILDKESNIQSEESS